jgi:hypothetical protein
MTTTKINSNYNIENSLCENIYNKKSPSILTKSAKDYNKKVMFSQYFEKQVNIIEKIF